MKTSHKLALSLALSTAFTLPALAEGTQQDTPQNFDMSADNFAYSNDGKSLTATGNVQITSTDGSVWADKVTYNADTGAVEASGNVIYVNENNLTAFMERIELTDSMKSGVMHKLRIEVREGEDAPRLAAESAQRIDRENMSLTNVAYSPCSFCHAKTDDDLPWKIRAGKVTYNDTKGHITYNNAYLDIYGKTVLYMPWFRHPVKEVAVNGFLPPIFGNSTNNGFSVSSAYYTRFADNHDMTLRAKYMTKRGTQFTPEMRYQGENLKTEIRAGIIDDRKFNETRSHLETKTEYVAKKGRRIGLVGRIASDDSYFDDFYQRTDAYLSTEAYIEDASKDHYSALSATRYQDLTENSSTAQTAHLLPRFQMDRVFHLDDSLNKSIKIEADASAIHRSEGNQSQRLISKISYRDVHFTESGNRFAFETSLRGDLYNVDADETNSTSEDGVRTRILPQMSLLWDRSFISPEGTHKITPKAMLVVAPTGGNSTNIPNEDSLAYELDTNNLFDTNRFSGYDRVETGTRFIYGIDNHWGTPTDINWRFFLGQSIRLQDDADLQRINQDDSKQSDIVGYFQGTPTDWLSFKSNFRVDPADLDAKRMDNAFTIGRHGESFIQMTHTYVEDGPEELRLKGNYTFNDTWSLEGETRKDLDDDGRTLLTEGAIVFTEQCYRISLRAQRRGYESDDVPPSTSYTVNLELLAFGRD